MDEQTISYGHLGYSVRLLTAYEKGDAGDKAAECKLIDEVLLDQKTNAAQWKGIVAPTDIDFLSRYADGLRRKLPRK